MLEVILPRVALTMSDAVIAEWYVQVGEAVQAGDPLFSMETDKAVLDVESPASGVLSRVLHAAGERVAAGEVVALLDAVGGLVSQMEVSRPPRSVAPAAAELAKLLNIDLDDVVGSGQGGRVLEIDVMRANSHEERGGEDS